MAIGLYHVNKWKALLVVTMFFCGFLWTIMLSIGITCCAVAHDPYLRDLDIRGEMEDVYPRGGKNPGRYEYKFQHQNNENVLGKKLLQDSSEEFEYDNGYNNNMLNHKQQLKNGDVNSRSSYGANNNVVNSQKIPKDNSRIDNRNPTREHTPAKVSYISNDTNHERTSGQQLQKETEENLRLSKGTKKLPQAIIIGVKKGGTRALLEFLRIHPDVRAPGPEIHFFDKNYHKGLEWYRDQMPPSSDGQLTIEKTPSYLITKEVPRRIYSMSKDIKLIVVVRDPVTRAISDYTQAASKRGMKPFEQMAFLNNYTGLVNTSWGAIRIGVYAKYVDRWLKYFPLRQIHFVNGEKLISDPAKVMTSVQNFLGLPHVINENHFHFNETKGFPCIKKEVTSKPHCLGKSKGRLHPKVTDAILERLQDFFRPFNARLYRIVGEDFGWP